MLFCGVEWQIQTAALIMGCGTAETDEGLLRRKPLLAMDLGGNSQLLARLGVVRSLGRPQVSDDNPYSEARFKTLKYHPGFPDRFPEQAAATDFCRSFFPWYNHEHRHAGIAMLTPETVHYGKADAVIEQRQSTLTAAWRRHPERFVGGPPQHEPTPPNRLDQQTRPRDSRNDSLNPETRCAKVVDRFRGTDEGGPSSMKRNPLHPVVIALAVLLPALPARSGANLETWGTYDPERGYEWVAASQVLTPAGLVKAAGVHDRLRRGLDWQIQSSRVDHGLRDGEVADTDEWCALSKAPRGSYVQTEQDGRFISALLLAEVAVTATLAEATPGFFENGNPGTLFALTEVVPLHGRSATPAYALAPANRLVVHGRVFCAVTPSESVGVSPISGDRVVLLGEWGDHGVVRVGHWWDRIGHLALVEERDTLRWNFFPNFTNPPLSLSELYERVNGAVSGGLIDVTSSLVLQEHGSRERVEFVERLGEYESSGCRVLEVAERPGQGWTPTSISCPVTKRVQR